MSREIITRQRPVGSYTFLAQCCSLGLRDSSSMQRCQLSPSSIDRRPTKACLAKCNFRSHWLTTAVHELVRAPYIIQSSHFGLRGFWCVASDLWNTFLSFPFRNSLPGLQKSLTAPLRPRSHPGESVLPPRWHTPRTWVPLPSGEPQREPVQGCAD